jgi:hypothetical protein
MASGESKYERDRRVDKLWETLDTRREGHIDLNLSRSYFDSPDAIVKVVTEQPLFGLIC